LKNCKDQNFLKNIRIISIPSIRSENETLESAIIESVKIEITIANVQAPLYISISKVTSPFFGAVATERINVQLLHLV